MPTDEEARTEEELRKHREWADAPIGRRDTDADAEWDASSYVGRGYRDSASEELKKKWAEQIERARRGSR